MNNLNANELTQELVNSLFYYKDGLLFWRKSGKGRKKNGIAGSKMTNGYFNLGINGKRYYLHRIIYLMHHGRLPKEIDHIDGNPANNKIENLRECTRSENSLNKGLPKNNSSGVKGVGWRKDIGKWRAYIQDKGKHITLGVFSDIEDATSAVQQARESLNQDFCNHGI